jgi:ribosome-associated protein
MKEKLVPESEITEKFSRASGAGGQNVNRVSTKVETRWNFEKSKTFSPEEKEKIRQFLKNRINEKGEVVVVSQEARTQGQNRKLAIEKLNNLVKLALIPKKKRRSTKPTRASKERRLEEKRRIAEKKRQRSEKPKINEY